MAEERAYWTNSRIAGLARILTEFRGNNPRYFRGRTPEDRVQIAFLVSEELRKYFPQRYWPIVAKLIEIRFSEDKLWCTPGKLSRAVGRYKARIGAEAANKVAASYRHWFNRRASAPAPKTIQ